MNERIKLGLDDDDIELADIIATDDSRSKSTMSPQQKEQLVQEGAKHGFVSREPRTIRRRKVSPYTAQFGGKCRPEVKAIFQEASERLNCYDTVTLEKAIEALLEKEQFWDLVEEFKLVTQ